MVQLLLISPHNHPLGDQVDQVVTLFFGHLIPQFRPTRMCLRMVPDDWIIVC
jgi:hypothetical protein